MVILIAGSSHIGKTLLTQKLLEKYNYKFHWNREDSVIEIYIPIK